MNKQEKGWIARKESEIEEERHQAYKELEHWELRLKKARTEAQRKLAEKRIEYWKTLI